MPKRCLAVFIPFLGLGVDTTIENIRYKNSVISNIQIYLPPIEVLAILEDPAVTALSLGFGLTFLRRYCLLGLWNDISLLSFS